MSDGVLEIGYGILPKYQGNGYVTEIVKAMVKWALKQERVKQIEAETETKNLASKRVLYKAGFKLKYKNGREDPRFIFIHK